MDRPWAVALVVGLAILGVTAVLLAPGPRESVDPVDAGATACANATADDEVVAGEPHDRTTVRLQDANGTALATVDVRIADTVDLRHTGLSDTESLARGEGMLFVHESAGRYTYVMRDMDFPLDIVFVSAEGEITRIHHAPVPEEIPGGDGSFPGEGRYVLEVPRGYTNATGAGVGDCVVIPEGVAAS